MCSKYEIKVVLLLLILRGMLFRAWVWISIPFVYFEAIGRFRSSTSTSTSFQLRNRSTHIEGESPSQLVLEAAVQYEFLSKSRTEQNEYGIDNIGENKCAIHKQLLR